MKNTKLSSDTANVVRRHCIQFASKSVPVFGSVISEIVDCLIDIQNDKDNKEAQRKLESIQAEMEEKIEDLLKISGINSDPADVVYCDFSRSLTDDEFHEFSELLKINSDVSFARADMLKDNDGFYNGILMFLDEEISGYEVFKLGEKINSLLEQIADDLTSDISY